MATFVDNFRAVQPRLQGTTLGNQALRNTFISPRVPSAQDIEGLEQARAQDTNNLMNERVLKRQAAEMGTLDAQQYDNPNLTAAYNSTLWDSDDARHYVDRKVFENYDLLNKMADEYGKIKTYYDGENILRKYYDKIDGKTSGINNLFNHFASGNRILRDTEDSGDFSDPQEISNYMKYILNTAKSKYSSNRA